MATMMKATVTGAAKGSFIGFLWGALLVVVVTEVLFTVFIGWGSGT